MGKFIVKGIIIFYMVFFSTTSFCEDINQKLLKDWEIQKEPPTAFERYIKQKHQQIFPSYKAVGELSQEDKEQYFKVIGEKIPEEDAKAGSSMAFRASISDSLRWKPKPFDHTEHQIGYLPFETTIENNGLREIQSAHSIPPDTTLNRINIILDKLRVYDYPGSGKHQILFTFRADNSLPLQGQQKENVSFSQVYEAQEGEGAGVSGLPIFIGLNVGKEGADFHVATINIKNYSDEKALNFLKSKEFKSGLTLLTNIQPALMPLTAFATGIGELVLSRNENKKVQDFRIGLDFNRASFGARLSQGNYIVFQAPDKDFRWEDWAYDPVNARIVKKNNLNEVVPYNYVIFRVVQHLD